MVGLSKWIHVTARVFGEPTMTGRGLAPARLTRFEIHDNFTHLLYDSQKLAKKKLHHFSLNA